MTCLFCRIVAGELPSRKVYEDEDAFAFLDINPWHRGHTLVIPKHHSPDILADPQPFVAIAPAIATVSRMLVDKLGADGLNVLSNAGAVSGQEVFHLHVHLVPRYAANPGIRALIKRDPTIDLDEVYARLTS